MRIALLLLALFLAACGQKGPLVLPAEPEPAPEPVTAPDEDEPQRT